MLLPRDTTMMIPAVILPIVGLFWIFVLWMLWKVIQALRSIDEDLKQIASNQNQQKTGTP